MPRMTRRRMRSVSIWSMEPHLTDEEPRGERCRVGRALLSLLALVPLARPVHAEEVAALISAVAANARFAATARADVRIERLVDGAPTMTEVILLGRGTTLYLEARDGIRA